MTSEIVLLTGGGGIIGRAITTTLAAQGQTVVVVDRDLELAKDAAALVADGTAHAYQCDISDRAALVDLRARVTDEVGAVTSLICNAATKSENFFAPYEEFPRADWDEVMATNLTGPMLCAQVFGEPLAAAGRGSIVNVLSIYGIVAPDQRIYEGSLYEGRAINTPAVYSASKAGLWGLTKYLASYWGAAGVRVNAVTPGGGVQRPERHLRRELQPPHDAGTHGQGRRDRRGRRIPRLRALDLRDRAERRRRRRSVGVVTRP